MKKQSVLTGFDLRRELLREFYSLGEMTLDTCEYVLPKINVKIHKDNYKLFKKTLRVLWRKHKRQKDFYSVTLLRQLQDEALAVGKENAEP